MKREGSRAASGSGAQVSERSLADGAASRAWLRSPTRWRPSAAWASSRRELPAEASRADLTPAQRAQYEAEDEVYYSEWCVYWNPGNGIPNSPGEYDRHMCAVCQKVVDSYGAHLHGGYHKGMMARWAQIRSPQERRKL